MTRPAAVLVALDKFKGSIDAAAACRAVADGITAAGQQAVPCPVADGGDGTLDALASAGFDRVRVPGHGPLGDPTTAALVHRDEVAVVELASVSGLAALPGGRLEPWGSGTLGVGTVALAAVEAGARHVVIALGGSASTDGGVGLLLGLGARVLDISGAPCTPNARGLLAAHTLDLSTLDPRLRQVRFSVATDVTSPLTGPTGAAHLFGPQKGLTPADVDILDRALHAWAALLHDVTGIDATSVPGAGAAGGTAAALVTALGADVISGADFVMDAIGLDQKLNEVGLVVTGEGSWDDQSEAGKAPMGVISRSARAGIPVVLVAGRVTATATRLAQLGVHRHYQLLDLQPDPAEAMRSAAPLLYRTGTLLAQDERADTDNRIEPQVAHSGSLQQKET
ncbi:glycerate kinase [Nakamurella sp. GG22]